MKVFNYILLSTLILLTSCGQNPKDSDPNNYKNKITGNNFPIDLGTGIGGCGYCASYGAWTLGYDITGTSIKGVFSGEWGNYSFSNSGAISEDIANIRIQFPQPMGTFQVDELKLSFDKSTPVGSNLNINYEGFSMGGQIDNGITTGIMSKSNQEPTEPIDP